MKRLALILVAVALMLATACSRKSELKLGVAMANTKCPMEIEEGMVVTEITMDGDNIVYVCEMAEDGGVTVCDMNNPITKAIMKEAILASLRYGADSETRDFMELVKATETTIVYRLEGKTSGCGMNVPVRYTELK